MSDWLVKLYDLPVVDGEGAVPNDAGGADAPHELQVRKPIGPEHALCVDWVTAHFGPGWASELQVALGNRPVTAFIAVRGPRCCGFACYDATARGMLGPIGVAPEARGSRVGARLLTAALKDMRAAGYMYAVVGGVGPGDFFQRVAGAVEIPGSSPGPYRGMLRP